VKYPIPEELLERYDPITFPVIIRIRNVATTFLKFSGCARTFSNCVGFGVLGMKYTLPEEFLERYDSGHFQ
jgi:hypothetical protein